jgi:hypothetical protein
MYWESGTPEMSDLNDNGENSCEERRNETKLQVLRICDYRPVCACSDEWVHVSS